MKKMSILLVTALVGLFAVSGFAGPKGEAQLYYTSDNSPALRIKNGSKKYTCVVTIYGDSNATNTVVIGSTTTTIDMSGTAIDTIAELAAAIRAATDDDGNTPLVVDEYAGSVLASETVDDELMVEAKTIQPSSWGSIDWDTSDTQHYRAAVTKSQYGAHGLTKVTSVYGSAGGTGDITVLAYINRVEVYRKVIESPIYSWSAAGTTETWAEDDVTMGVIDIPLNLIVGSSDALIVSVTRETTGTTGGIGIRTEQP